MSLPIHLPAKLPAPLAVLAAAAGGIGWLIGHQAAQNAAAPAPAEATAPSSSAGSGAGPDSATLDFGSSSTGAGSLNGITPGANPVPTDLGYDYSSGQYVIVPTPGPVPLTGPGPTPTPTPTPTPSPSSSPKGAIISFAPGAIVRIYAVSSAGCLASDRDVKRGSKASSAPGTVPIRRRSCSNTSAAMTSRILKGTYAGQTIRVGQAGVSYRLTY